MACPTSWPYKSFFYPIGDVVATCFTSELPPEKHAEILLLGCGDASSILYTIYADLGARTRPELALYLPHINILPETRNLDFTCCDLEPAVLARNVLLFTLIADMPSMNYDEFISKIWSIYRRPFLDEDTLEFLLKHCHRLLDLSSEISSWNETTYGRLFRFCTTHTLSSIRSHWELYVATANCPDFKETLSKEICRYSVKGKRSRATLHRSAGPLALELEAIGTSDYCSGGALLNPTFSCSAGRHGPDLYEDLNPLLSFHLAEALAPLRDADLNAKRSMMSLVNFAMAEFADWCQAFHQRLKLQPTSLVIRFFYGDALAFCRALRYCAIHGTTNTGVYAKPWSLTVIDLDEDDYVSGDAPVHFNVIDTSNLTDHVGLLNLLIACKPLMQTSPSSVLYTNAMHRLKGVPANTAGFLKRLCGDVSLLSLILDLIPITYVSNFTTRANVHEIMVQKQSHSDYLQGQLHEQVFWRIGSMSDSEVIRLSPLCDQRLKFDENDLANFLFDVYQAMFSDEYNSSILLPGPQNGGNDYSQVQYIRSSFAYLLRVVKDKVDVDWESFMRHFNGRLYDNPSLSNSPNFLSELLCAFHLLDVHTTTPVVPPFPANFLLKEWKDTPAVVCIAMQVPRERFETLEHANWPEFGTLILMCCLVAGDAVVHQFQDYQSFFGHVTAAYPGPEPLVTFEEDPLGALGLSPVVFAFYAPSWVLDSSLDVALSIRASTDVITNLGLATHSGHIFLANITDRTHVHVTRERPGNIGEPQKLRIASLSLSVSSRARPLYDAIEVVFDSTGKGVAMLTACASGFDKLVAAAEELSMGAVELIANIRSVQISPQVERLSWGDFQPLTIAFPFPIDSRYSRSDVNFKFRKIRLTTLIRNPEEDLGMLNLFPTVKYHGSLHLWNLHYINLDRLPALDLGSNKRLAFIWPHLLASFSDRERSLQKKARSNRKSSDPILRAKRNLFEFFAKISLPKYNHNRVFSLADEHGIHTFIFLNDLRLDLAFHTILADVVVLPLPKFRENCLRGPLRKLQNAGISPVIDDADETDTIVWQYLLPAVTERCRRWEHTDSCEYLSAEVPESQEKPLICSCGQGVNLGLFEERDEWKPFAPYATRAAFSPLFGVPFGNTLAKQVVKDFRVLTGVSICAKCGGPGKPQLFVCSSCRKARYCSTVCQKADWKAHRTKCKSTYFLGKFPYCQ